MNPINPFDYQNDNDSPQTAPNNQNEISRNQVFPPNNQTDNSRIETNSTDKITKPQKSHLKLILILIGSLVIIAGAVLLVLFLTIWSKPTAQDYKTASADLHAVRIAMETSAAHTDYVDLMNSGKITKDTTTETSDKIHQAIATMRADIAKTMTKLKGDKAITNDKTAQAKFKTFSDLVAKYDAILAKTDTIYGGKFFPTLVSTWDATAKITSAVNAAPYESDSWTNFAKVANDNATKLRALKIDDEATMTYLAAYAKADDDFAAVYKQMATAVTKDDYAAFSDAQDRTQEIRSELNGAAQKTYTDALTKMLTPNLSDIDKAGTDLNTYLTSQASQAK